MKRIVVIIALIFCGVKLMAQENDTTKIKLGDTKIIIIENDKKDKSKEDKIEQTRKEFEKLLADKQKALKEQENKMDTLEKEMKLHQENLEKQQDELVKKEEEKKVEELNKQVEENNKKIAELNKEVEALNKGIKGLEEEDFKNDKNKDDDDDWSNKKFDWDFDEGWPRDWDNMSPFGHKNKFRGHWAGFELGLNNYMDSNNKLTFDEAKRGFELDGGHSWVFTLNFLEFNIPFGKYAGIVSGLGTSWNNYHFNNNVNFYKDSSGVMVATPETVKSYNKNSFHTWSFTFPMIFEIQLPSNGHNSGIYLGFGAYGVATVSSKAKLEYELDGVSYKEKRRADFQINNLRYGLTARLGLKYLRFFANYDLVPLFEKDRGPELYPVSLGIMLVSF